MSQLVTLTVYGKLCYGDLKQTYIDRSGSEIKAQVNLGPGYYFYVVCLFGAFMVIWCNYAYPVQLVLHGTALLEIRTNQPK